MAQTATKRPRFIAETRDVANDNRKRLKFSSAAKAAKRAAADKSRRDRLLEVMGDTTMVQATEALMADLKAGQKDQVAASLRCHLKYMAPVLEDKIVRLQSVKTMAEIAQKLRPYYADKSPAYFRQGLDFLCRVLRFQFQHLTPPVSYTSQLPGLQFQRAAYGSKSPQYNKKPIPIGDEISLRLTVSTGGLRILLHILLLLGLRIGEALGLNRGDVSQDGRGRYWVHVQGSQMPNGKPKGPKSLAGTRRIPLNSRMQKLLLEWLDATQGEADDQLVSGMAGVRLVYREVVAMHKAFQKSLGGPIFGFHRYRAACVTTWLLAGVPLRNVMRWIGHADLRMTVQVYASSIIFAEAVWWMKNPKCGASLSPGARVQTALASLQTPVNDDEHSEMEAVA